MYNGKHRIHAFISPWSHFPLFSCFIGVFDKLTEGIAVLIADFFKSFENLKMVIFVCRVKHMLWLVNRRLATHNYTSLS